MNTSNTHTENNTLGYPTITTAYARLLQMAIETHRDCYVPIAGPGQAHINVMARNNGNPDIIIIPAADDEGTALWDIQMWDVDGCEIDGSRVWIYAAGHRTAPISLEIRD